MPDFEPDLESVIEASAYIAAAGEGRAEVEALLAEAKAYLEFYDWAGPISSAYVGAAFPGILGIFLFHHQPARPDADPWIWVVVGDVPPAYLTCEDARRPWEALDGYIGALELWVEAARAGKSVAGLIPVNAPATPEWADALSKRLVMLDQRILPLLRDDDSTAR